MGGKRDAPAHTVTLGAGFYLQTTEVTQAQWEEVMGTNPSQFRGGSRPVENVSWDDVQAFMVRLNAKENDARYRLPTEAEWEYTCRAGGGPVKSSPGLIAEAWTAANSGNETHPVAQLRANTWGLFDLLGNVEEWVQDHYGVTTYGRYSRVDPSEAPTLKHNSDEVGVVARGGAWHAPGAATVCAERVSLHRDLRLNLLGFRCARSQ